MAEPARENRTNVPKAGGLAEVEITVLLPKWVVHHIGSKTQVAVVYEASRGPQLLKGAIARTS